MPLQPACAMPLSCPRMMILPPALISAPGLTSPTTMTLPSNSIFCPLRREPLWNFARLKGASSFSRRSLRRLISLFSVFTKVISIVVCFAIIFKRVSSSSSVNIRPLKAREVFTLSKNLPASATFFSSCVQRVSKDTSGSKITVTPSFVPLKIT